MIALSFVGNSPNINVEKDFVEDDDDYLLSVSGGSFSGLIRRQYVRKFNVIWNFAYKIWRLLW